MEDSYANYTIDPQALRQGMEVLGAIAAGVAMVAAIANPAGAAAAGVFGLCTAVGAICDSFSVGSYLAEGDLDGAKNEINEVLLGKCGSGLVKGIMKTGARFTEEEIKQMEALLVDMPCLADDLKEIALENKAS